MWKASRQVGYGRRSGIDLTHDCGPGFSLDLLVAELILQGVGARQAVPGRRGW